MTLAVFGFGAAAVRAKDSKATLKANGMSCSSCDSAVKGALTKVDGVKSVDANAEMGTAVVAYDPAKTREEKIAAAINTTKFKVAK
jgi:copper chaperone CopZ